MHHSPGGGQTQADAAKGQERSRLFAFLKASQEQGGLSTPQDFRNFVKSASQPQHFAPPLAGMNPQEQHHPNQQPPPKYLTQHHSHQQQQVKRLLSGQYQQNPQVCFLPTQICDFHPTDCGDASQNDPQHVQHEQVAHKPRQPGSPPSPNVPPKGILKTASLKAPHAREMPSNPMSAAGSNPVSAAGTPDYPMMGPLPDGRDSAPHAMAGHNEGSGPPIDKGICAVCQGRVYNFESRTKNGAGRVHACIRTLSVRVCVGGIADLRRHRAGVSTQLPPDGDLPLHAVQASTYTASAQSTFCPKQGRSREEPNHFSARLPVCRIETSRADHWRRRW